MDCVHTFLQTVESACDGGFGVSGLGRRDVSQIGVFVRDERWFEGGLGLGVVGEWDCVGGAHGV